MMEGRNPKTGNTAATLTASVFGVLAGIGGITHAIGEIRQGNVAPTGLIINSWAEGPIATNMGGEPGMTIIPNLLITGILDLIISLAIVVWAAAFMNKRNGGWILILLSTGMLLVGGGFGPPIMGILAGVAGLGVHAPLIKWWTHLPMNLIRFLAMLWPWIFAISLLNGVFLVIGSVALVYFTGLNNADLFVNSFFLAVLSLLLMIITGRAYDVQSDRQMLSV
jgi:hypothetical protein